MRVLVTGATGYIGGRLVPRLLAAGHEVTCLARHPEKLDDLPWRDRVSVAEGDVLDATRLKEVAAGCDAGFYLVHSMAAGKEFAAIDQQAAANFRDAAADAGMLRVVYLGGLGPEQEDLSPHLASRHRVGATLASGSTPVTELRAAVIIGSGSLSFEMLRYLTEVLPVMTTPRWVRTRCQPIAVEDILDLLVTAASDTSAESRIVEVGGPDVLTYQEMMQIYAEEAGLRRRLILPVPLLTPRLSSLWVGLVTPLPTRVARPLVESLRHEVIVGDTPGAGAIPYHPISYRRAVRNALAALPAGTETRWSDAESSPAHPVPGDPRWSGGTLFEDQRLIPTDALPHHMYWACTRIGGDVGYYGMNWAWKLRGFADRLVGGVGLRRGRRHPEQLRVGEAVDFWRVDQIIPNQMLRLHAEMRLPGEAWLEWKIVPTGEGSDLLQTARFQPRGLLGRLYWFGMAPFHSVIFPRMAAKMAAAAEERGYACGE
ncbi:MAG: SDR family oxidoreductase [Actinobacteria bacterium]|nr:SDR family oxidoreductase [Actinomycetota bacterium]